MAGRLALKSLELGIRQDGGDAETGRGLDLGLGRCSCTGAANAMSGAEALLGPGDDERDGAA